MKNKLFLLTLILSMNLFTAESNDKDMFHILPISLYKLAANGPHMTRVYDVAFNADIGVLTQLIKDYDTLNTSSGAQAQFRVILFEDTQNDNNDNIVAVGNLTFTQLKSLGQRFGFKHSTSDANYFHRT